MSLKEAFLSFNRAMTCQDVATIIPLKPETIRRKAKRGELPSLSCGGRVLFDPKELADYYSPQRRSLTIKRHISSQNSNQKGVFKCL